MSLESTLGRLRLDILRMESTPKALAPTPDSIGLPNTYGLSSSLPDGSIEPDPKKCNRPPSVEIDSTRIDSTWIDRPASEPVAQEELDTHAVGEAPCDTRMATTTIAKQDEVCTPDVHIGILNYYEGQECTPHVHIKADEDQECTPHDIVHIKADGDQVCTPDVHAEIYEDQKCTRHSTRAHRPERCADAT